MISTVAVGTDGSETASTAVAPAFDLAERYGARLVIISAISAPQRQTGAVRLSGAASTHPGWAANEAEQVERILAAAEESAAERGIECRTAMAPGDPQRGPRQPSRAAPGGRARGRQPGHGTARARKRPDTVSHKAACSVFVVKTS